MIARNDEEWRALWAAHAGPSTVAPPVDFVARMVAAVFQGQRPSAGFETTIVDARAEGDVLTVQVDEHLPAAGRAGAHVLVSPFHIVSLPRVEGEVRFEDVYRHANEVTQAQRANPERGRMSTTLAARRRPRLPGSRRRPPARWPTLRDRCPARCLLIVERTSRSVRFHAWQALLGLGALGLGAFLCLGLAFAMLIVSPRGFSVLRWMAGVAAVAWVGFWAIGLVQAYKGRRWKMPIAGDYADRWAGR